MREVGYSSAGDGDIGKREHGLDSSLQEIERWKMCTNGANDKKRNIYWGKKKSSYFWPLPLPFM